MYKKYKRNQINAIGKINKDLKTPKLNFKSLRATETTSESCPDLKSKNRNDKKKEIAASTSYRDLFLLNMTFLLCKKG